MSVKESVMGFLGLCIVVCLFVLVVTRKPWLTVLSQIPTQAGTDTSRAGYAIHTPGCRIPDLDPYDKTVKGLVSKGSKIDCTLARKFPITYQDGGWLRMNKTVIKNNYTDGIQFCDYVAIFRVPLKDSGFKFGKDKIRFQNDVAIKDEFIKVQCYNRSDAVVYLNFHAFIQPKPQVNERYLNSFNQYKKKYGIERPLNVILLGVDSVSKLNSIRQLSKTRDFLLKNLNAVEFHGYNKVADNTFPNIIPLLVGMFLGELPFKPSTVAKNPMDGYDFIWKHFANMGYRTLLAEDAPSMSTFNYIKFGFRNPPTDYYYRPFSLAIERTSLWSHSSDCFSGRLETAMILEWLANFITMSKDKPFFAFTFISRPSHYYVNKVGAVDETYYNFVKTLKLQGHLDNTVLFYFSDHGMRFGAIRSTYIGKMEERLPMMYIYLPEWLKTKYPSLDEHLHSNAYKLTTPFDVHETLKDILYISNVTGKLNRSRKSHHDLGANPKPNVTDRGISLFSKIPAERTCRHAAILPHWCTCYSEEPIPTNSTISLKIANFIVQHLNNLTSSSRRLCAELTLLALNKVSRSLSNSAVLGHGKNLKSAKRSIIDYQMTLVTVPGKAMFEATVRHFEGDDRFMITGEISRINLYDSQSECINDFMLKRYCFCIH